MIYRFQLAHLCVFQITLDGDAKQSQTLKAHPSAEPDPGCHKEMTNRKKDPNQK